MISKAHLAATQNGFISNSKTDDLGIINSLGLDE